MSPAEAYLAALICSWVLYNMAGAPISWAGWQFQFMRDPSGTWERWKAGTLDEPF